MALRLASRAVAALAGPGAASDSGGLGQQLRDMRPGRGESAMSMTRARCAKGPSPDAGRLSLRDGQHSWTGGDGFCVWGGGREEEEEAERDGRAREDEREQVSDSVRTASDVSRPLASQAYRAHSSSTAQALSRCCRFCV